MSRLEEHNEMVDKWKNNHFTGTSEQVNIKLNLAQVDALHDIGKSLAMLADLCAIENNKESE